MTPVPKTITLAQEYATDLKACFDVTTSFRMLRDHVDQTEAIVRAAREVVRVIGTTEHWMVVESLKQAINNRKDQ